MGAARTLLAGLVMVVCACGAVTRPAAVVSPVKPSPEPSKVYASPTAEPSSAPWVMPFEAIDFIDRSHGWEVSLEQAGMKVDVSRTSDGGATWSGPVQAATFVLGDTPTPRFRVRFANLNDGWLFGQGMFATTDGGAGWSASSLNAFVYDAGIVGSSVWAVTDKGLFRSQVGTTTWTLMPGAPTTGPGPLQLIRASANVAYLVQQAQFETRLFRTTDGGTRWIALAVPCRGYAMPVATLDGVHLWMVCGGEPGAGNQQKWTYTSDDSGAHWTLRAYNDGVKSSGLMGTNGYARLLALTSATTGFMAADRGGLSRSTDGGRTWVAIGFAPEDTFFMDLQFVDGSTGWISAQTGDIALDGRIGLFRTTDGGASWALVASAAGSAV